MSSPEMDNVFASSALTGELLKMPVTDYLRGWGYLGNSEPPPMEYFNYITNLQDKRIKFLAQMSGTRLNATAYAVGDVIVLEGLPSWAYLHCTVAGTSGNTEPVISASVKEGDSITDGEVTWVVRGRIQKEIIVSKIEPTNPESDLWIELSDE